MPQTPRRVLCLPRLFLACIVALGAPGDDGRLIAGDSVNDVVAPRRRALLIGCSQYPLAPAGVLNPLPGAANDVARYAGVWRERFQADDVTDLAGWPDDERLRPTAAGIAAAFEGLIERTETGDHVFIAMSGHGTQFPVPAEQTDLLDAVNPEPDGMDEVFLAADFANDGNMIRDDQVGTWLRRLSDKGGHVWIVFDCCHSGTMTRGRSDVREWSRGVNPDELGVKPADLTRVQEAASRLHDHGGEHGAVPQLASSERGSVVAFYACQPFETAKEVIRPEDGPILDEHRCGLLSYHVLRGLQQAGTSLSYRDLSRVVVSGLRAELGSRGPTPMFEGALDRPLLESGADWPVAEPLYLERHGASFRVSGGELAGLAPHSILELSSLATTGGAPLGYARVTTCSLVESVVEPVPFAETPAADLARLTLPVRCRVVSQEWSTPVLRVGWETCEEQAGAAASRKHADLQAALREATPDDVEWVPSSETERYGVAMLPPAEIQGRFGRQAEAALVLYERRQTAATAVGGAAAESTVAIGVYPLSLSTAELQSRLVADLRKISACQNLWRIAQAYGGDSPLAESHDVTLDVTRTSGTANTTPAGTDAPTRFRPGDRLQVKVGNRGFESQWYSVFFINGNYGVEFVTAGTIPGRPIGPRSTPVVQPVERMEVTASATGVEGYLVLAVPLRENRAEPDFRFLAQPGVGDSESRSTTPVPTQPTLFEGAMLQAMSGRGTVRSGLSPETPCVASYSWLTVVDR